LYKKPFSLLQWVFVAFVPLHEFGDAVVQAPVGLVAALGFELGGIGVGLVHVAGLHGQEVLFGRLAVSVFDFGDKVHELYGVAAADVVNLVGHVVRALGGIGHMVQSVNGAFGDVIDVGKVTDHVAVVEYLNRFALGNRAGKEHGRHVRASPRTVYGKEP